MYGSLLIPLDLSKGSDRVIGRAALLPLSPRARLTLLHVVAKTLPRESRRRAEDDARKALASQAERLRCMLPKGIAVEHTVSVGTAAGEIAKQAHAVEAELIVMGRGNARALRDAFLGSTAERVIRRARIPVLIVRLPPRAPYTRPALALELDQAAPYAIAALLRVLPRPRPPVAIVHAYDTFAQGVVYPSLSDDLIEEYREQYERKALRQISRLIEDVAAQSDEPSEPALPFKAHLQYGSPRTRIEKAVHRLKTDLLVLGTHGYSGAAQAFLGTVAGDVLRRVPCDVLITPPHAQAARAR